MKPEDLIGLEGRINWNAPAKLVAVRDRRTNRKLTHVKSLKVTDVELVKTYLKPGDPKSIVGIAYGVITEVDCQVPEGATAIKYSGRDGAFVDQDGHQCVSVDECVIANGRIYPLKGLRFGENRILDTEEVRIQRRFPAVKPHFTKAEMRELEDGEEIRGYRKCSRCFSIKTYNLDWFFALCPECADETERTGRRSS